jgi:regulator of sigma E protease
MMGLLKRVNIMPSGLLNSLWIVPILGILILVHEIGHFVAARLVGIRVEEFGMGLPPRLWGYKAKSGVIYSINWIPFGGFVKMYGQDDMRPDGGAAYGDDSFVSKTAPQRAFVLVAGVIMNLLLAILIFTVIAIGQGRPGPDSQVMVQGVLPDTPAAAAGWLPGDRIVSVAGQPIASADTLRGLTETYVGRAMPVVILRNGQQIATEVTPRVTPPEGQGRAGVTLTTQSIYEKVPLWQAPFEGVRGAWDAIRLQIDGLRQLFSGRVSTNELAGPIGMGQLTGEIVQRSSLPLWVTLGNLAALLSLNLFILNLLPLPALDGGRLVFVVLEMLRGGRKIAPEREGMVHFVGLLMLLALMFVIGFQDIMRLVRGDSFIP